MNPICRLGAEWLAHFHTWPQAIQEFWIIALTAMVLGVTYFITRCARDILRLLLWRGRTDEGQVVDGVYRDPAGRLMISRRKHEAKELAWSGTPGSLIRWEQELQRFETTEE